MQNNGEKTRQPDHEVEGLPVVRPNVAGMDPGSTQHWVCAPKKEEPGRDVEHFGATTPELEKMAEWLKERNVESVAMESTGVYWIISRHLRQLPMNAEIHVILHDFF